MPKKKKALSRKEKHKLIMGLQGMVVSVASKFARNSEEFLDLMQEGNVGLCIAAEKYDPDRPTKFSTMAMPWIKKYIREAAMECNAVHIPFSAQYKDRQLNRYSNQDYAQTGIRTYQARRLRTDVSIDTPEIFEELFDRYLLSEGTQIDLIYIAEEMREVNRVAEHLLSEREITIVRCRAKGTGSKTIGDQFGISKQRANQIYTKAVGRLQWFLEN